MEPLTRRLTWLSLFAIAMGYLEAAVVAYLRALYYPEGFEFPLVIIVDRMAAIEIAREAATILMLFAAAMLAGVNPWQRFALFSFTFGVWDVSYYVCLWIVLGWPPSLLTNDVLFLIPAPWIGPVLAPLLVSVSLIAAAAIILRLQRPGARIDPAASAWIPAIAGGGLVLLAFMIDAGAVLRGEMPPPFRWWLFGAGMGLGWAALVLGVRRVGARRISGAGR